MNSIQLVVAITAVAATGLAVVSMVRIARSLPTARLREVVSLASLSLLVVWIMMVYAAIFGLRNTGHLATLTEDAFFTIGLILNILMAVALGRALFVLPNTLRKLAKTQNLASVLSSRVDHAGPISELGLTLREFEVLEAMSQGDMSNEAISAALTVTPSTAATHVRNILRKTGMKNREDLVALHIVSDDTRIG